MDTVFIILDEGIQDEECSLERREEGGGVKLGLEKREWPSSLAGCKLVSIASNTSVCRHFTLVTVELSPFHSSTWGRYFLFDDRSSAA